MSMKGAVVRALLVALAVGIGAVALSSPASAEKVCTKRKVGDTIVYDCVETGPGGTSTGSGSSGGGASQPPCDLKGEYNDLCIGDDACWMNDPAAVQKPKELEGVPKPEPDSYVVYIKCQRPDGSTYDRWYWNNDVPTITIEDRIRSAVGALDLPTIKASFNPEVRTLVNLPTWWWAEGAPPGEIQGSEALGMVAFAVPRGLTIEPGDGSVAISCPMTVQESDTCIYNYRRSGDYTATVSIVYDIRFEFGGRTLPLAEIPADLRTLTVDDDVAVAVREVQTRVTKVR